MRKLVVYLALCCVLFLSAPRLYAQSPLPPIDLGIQNIPQQTHVWCWAAVAQQIIQALRGPNGTPSQCALVAIASNFRPDVCCYQMHPACMRTGQLGEIQNLILHFGGHYSTLAPPADPMTVYQTLASRRAIIMAVQSSQFAGHVVVIRGMEWVPTPMGFQPVLHINDPMNMFTQPVPFMNILPFWREAIVVY